MIDYIYLIECFKTTLRFVLAVLYRPFFMFFWSKIIKQSLFIDTSRYNVKYRWVVRKFFTYKMWVQVVDVYLNTARICTLLCPDTIDKPQKYDVLLERSL
jgi:hypothetical protein